VMPEMLGPDLIKEFKMKGPVPSVLFISGYGAGALNPMVGEYAVLPKPFSAQELLQATQQALRMRRD